MGINAARDYDTNGDGKFNRTDIDNIIRDYYLSSWGDDRWAQAKRFDICPDGFIDLVDVVLFYSLLPPTVSPAAGTYADEQKVTFSSTEPDASIYYTTNGSKPDNGSMLYSHPIAISNTTTINAMAINPNGNETGIETYTYDIENSGSTPTSISFSQKFYNKRVPSSGNSTVLISALVKDENGNVISGAAVTYSILPDYPGVAIDSLTGEVTISPSAPTGSAIIVAAHGTLQASAELKLMLFTSTLQYDTNGDGIFDELDITNIIHRYFEVTNADDKWSEAWIYDLNDNGVVNIQDILLLYALL